MSSYNAAYYAANRERIKEKQRAWQEAHPGYARQYWRENKHKYRDHNLRHKHGIGDPERIAMLEAQGGCCYLCGDELALDESVIDHDHRCCPKNRSCPHCRRGLAHDDCNLIIGNAHDDPDKLERIAAALRTVLPLMEERLAARPEQLTLDGG